jgi:hypothetical protein
MRGFKLDPESHDLALDAGGRLEYVEGDDATAQEIKTRLLHFQGESFNDLREGVPWYQEILIKGTDLARVRAIIRTAILSVPAVLDVPKIEVSLDRATRALTITWEARVASGRVIRSEDYAPLVVAAT